MINKNRLKILREQSNYTQKEVANKLGVSQQQYQRLESGKTTEPRLDTLEGLADVLNTTVEYLTETEILSIYNKLTTSGKKEILDYAIDILKKEEIQNT